MAIKPSPTRILETERLILRQLAPEDLDALFAFYQDSRVSRFLPGAPRHLWQARQELDAIIDHYDRWGFGLWATLDRESGSLIGRCGLAAQQSGGTEVVEVSWALAPAFWGMGLATEAGAAIVRYGFEHLHLPRLVGLIDAANYAAVRVAQKIGMRLEQESRRDGKRVLHYALSAPQEDAPDRRR